MPAPEPLTDAELAAFAAAWNDGEILRHHGFRLSFRPGVVVATLSPVLPHHRGGLGSDAVNGGVLASMFDFAVGCTAVLAPPLRRSATVQLSIAFERAVRGDHARCEAWVERATGSLVFVSSQLLDATGAVCARCQGIVSLGPQQTIEQWTRALAPAPPA